MHVLVAIARMPRRQMSFCFTVDAYMATTNSRVFAVAVLKTGKLSDTCLRRHSAFTLSSCERRRKSMQGNRLETSPPVKVTDVVAFALCSPALFPVKTCFNGVTV